MKKFQTFIAAFLLIGVAAFATTTTKTGARFIERGYGNSFIFVEQGVEFAVFPDGQFDFNVDNYSPNFSAYLDFGGVGISYNTGHSYDAYVQYDDYGAVIQIENVPIYYDFYGRIVSAGDVRIRYNNFGRVSRVGGLYIHYNTYNKYSHYTGFINTYNRYYVYRPWHTYYAVPVVNLCIVYNKPYRQNYQAVRYTYYRPYRDNYRPHVSYNAERRDSRSGNYRHRSDRYIQDNKGRRDQRFTENSRSVTKRSNYNKREISRQDKKVGRSSSGKYRNAINKSDDRLAVQSKSRKNRTGELKTKRVINKSSTQKKRVSKTNIKSQNSRKKKSSQRLAKATTKRETSSKSNKSKRRRQ